MTGDADEKALRAALSEVREIHDLISESDIVYQAGIEYLNNFDLYQKAEQDPEALEKEMELQKAIAEKEKEEIQSKQLSFCIQIIVGFMLINS